MKRIKYVNDLIDTIMRLEEHGEKTSLTNIAKEMGYASHRSIYPLLEKAQEMGLLEYKRNGKRVQVTIELKI